MDKGIEHKLTEFRKNVTNAGEDAVFRLFPSKILELEHIIQLAQCSDSPFNVSHASTSTDATIYSPPQLSNDEPQAKKRKLSADGTIDAAICSLSLPGNTDLQYAKFPCRVLSNKHLPKNVHEKIKRECEQLIASVDKVKLWVTLTMPKIEDGDNFGVQIQEEVLAELHRAQECGYNLRDAALQDHTARAKICSKLIKYPNIEDYALALKEHDEKQLYLALQHLHDLRNLYAVLTDLIHKNISKIRAPKANNSIGLY